MNGFLRLGVTGFLCLVAGVWTAGAEIFYVDAKTGNDARRGTAPEQAWKTLERVNRQTFKPGDRLLFMAGTRYRGQLGPQGSGASTNGHTVPITIAKYGGDALPRIDGEGKYARHPAAS